MQKVLLFGMPVDTISFGKNKAIPVREVTQLYQLLIVDDEMELRNGFASLFPFDELGFTVAGQAANGQEALDIMEHQHIDVVLTDIMMPVMDGLNLAQEIYRLQMPVIVIIISGYSDFEYAQKAIEYNVRKYIIKPTKYAELSDMFSKLRIELDEKNQSQSSDYSGYYLNMVETIKQYVDNNYSDATLERAAKLVHLNPYYLSNVFRLTTGVKFSDYLVRIKMKKAAVLLKDQELKIHAIGPQVGYANANNFARAFKSFYHMTPSEYRDKLLGNYQKGNNDVE